MAPGETSGYSCAMSAVTPSKPSRADPPARLGAPKQIKASPASANAAAASFKALTAKLDYLDASDIERVRQAYRFADEAHLGQLRSGGEPYITHPIAVAAQCANWKLDAQALMAALLHDAIEDCGVTKHELIERFGAPVAELVDGLTKLEKLEFNTREENQIESFRKMLLAMARDVRVILIKLADRSHNMRTLADVPRSKWHRIASETLEIYAPIAHRLGLNDTYRELQDLSFQYLWPWRHKVLAKAIGKARSRRRELVRNVKHRVEASFANARIEARVAGREKTLYSIYSKMHEKRLSFAKVSDIYGFRIIVPEVVDCYTGLGLLHQLYKPVPGRFKDYIAIAKLNGYQSLHTTLVGPSSITIEFQLRTDSMNAVADSGVAAHWLYKAKGAGNGGDGLVGAKSLQSLLEIQDETRDAAEFWDHVKVDLFPDAVYVFTPKGQIRAMPRGATVIDFAYAIHSNVGDRAVSAHINNEPVALRSEIKNGDVVEVLTSPEAKPNANWLGFVTTGRARSKIRHYLKTTAHSESLQLGEVLLTQALRAEGIAALPNEESHSAVWERLLRFSGNRGSAELFTDIGLGKRIASIVAKRLAKLMIEGGEKPDPLLLSRERFVNGEALTQGAITLDGSQNASVVYAPCCRPVPGDPIVGYLGHGEGLAVHAETCNVARKLKFKDAERFMSVEWSDEPVRPFEAGIMVTVTNGKGVLAQVAGALSSAEVNITHIDMDEQSIQDTAELRFVVAVRDRDHLESALHHVRGTLAVISAKRLRSGDA